MRKPKSINIQKIAEATGFNISTVSRALNNHPQVATETMEKITAAAQQLGYRSQPARRRVIALIMPESTMKLAWYSLGILNGLRGQATRRGHTLECISADQVDLLNDHNVAGAVSFDFDSHLAVRMHLRNRVPLVCINDQSNHENGVYSVCSDDFEAIRRVVGYLVNFGHKRIGLILNGRDDTQANRIRREAFRQMCGAFSLDTASACVSPCKEMADMPDLPLLYEHVRQFHRSGITAIINTGESEAISAVHSLAYCGIRVPEEMSLVTWELPMISQYLPFNLTTIGQNFAELTRQALSMLEELMDKRAVTSDVKVDYLFNERGSVTFPRASS